MAIDMMALDRAAEGDPNARVTVNKRWLREVHRQLTDGAAAKAELDRRRREGSMFDAIFGGVERR